MPSARISRRSALALGLALTPVFDACSRSSAALTPTVFAPSSLTEVLESALSDADVQLHFAGTPRLVFQLEEGARADVLVTADRANMQRAVDRGLCREAPRVFARNRLAIATAKNNPAKIRGLADLARDDLRVALCASEVPAGRYARRALEKAGVRVQSRSDEPNVKALLTKVRIGELDAGIVYVTDVTSARGAVTGVEIDSRYNVGTVYEAATLRSAHSTDVADRAMRLLFDDRVLRALEQLGFERP